MYTPPHPDSISADIEDILQAQLPWRSLSGKKVLVTGAAGMLAAYIVDTLLAMPRYLGCGSPHAIALVRSRAKAEQRFAGYLSNPHFEIRTDDISKPLDAAQFAGVEVIVHAASIPRPDGRIPVDVLEPNILGTWNLLELARGLPGFEQFIYFSSGIVNGENIRSDRPISEEMFFPSSCTSPTACYSEAKRAAETICLSFMRQFGIPVKILRYFGSYGPGMDLSGDPRAFTSFIKNSVNGEDIVLLSPGDETRFWCYITDATEAFFRVFFLPAHGEAWNIANDQGGCTIRELADLACRLCPSGKISVRHDPRNAPRGYTPFRSQQVTIPDISKLRALGFTPKVSVEEGMRRTIRAYGR